MKIVKIERLGGGRFEVTVRHNWVEWLFGFAMEEKRLLRDSGLNFVSGESIYYDEHGNLLEPGDEFVSKVDAWRKAESLKR